MDSISCQNCEKSGAIHCCALCKNAFYCNEECGAEDWKDHHKECNVATVSRTIDSIMVPDDDDFTLVGDYFVQFGSGGDGFKLSEIARDFKKGEHHFFQPSKEGVPLGGKKVPDKVKLSYRLDVEAQVIKDRGDIYSTSIQGPMNDVVIERKFQSRAGTEVVIQTRFAKEAQNEGDSNVMISAEAPTLLTFTFYKIISDAFKTDQQAQLFSTSAIVYPATLFSNRNRVKAVRQTQRFFSDTKREAKKSMDDPGKEHSKMDRTKAFFKTITNPRLSSVFMYKGKSSNIGQGVKIGIEVEYSGGNDGILNDVWFKIPLKLWDTPFTAVVSDKISSPITTTTMKPNNVKVDTYNLEDITALCLHLRDSLSQLGEMMVDEDEEKVLIAMKKHSSKIKTCLKIMDQHHDILLKEQDNQSHASFEALEASPKVNAAIGQALEMQSIDALFKKSRKKAYKKTIKNWTITMLIKNGEGYIKRLDPKSALRTFVDVIRMGRGKAKIRLEAVMEVLLDRKGTGAVPEEQKDDVNSFLNRASDALASGKSIEK